MIPNTEQGTNTDARHHHNQQQAQQPLSETMSRLTLLDTAAQTALPPSSPVQQHIKSPAPPPLQTCPSPGVRNVSSSSPSTHQKPTPSPLRRSASAMSINGRSSSPALARRTSTASLRNGSDSPNSLHSPRLANRRSSSNLLLSQLMPALEEPAPLTAEKIATDHFAKELAHHADLSQSTECKTVVIIHDDCYGHKFSRFKTKDIIHSIVERPERIQAGVMGISAAFVRLGERHSGGIYAPHPKKSPSKDMPFRIIRSSRKVPLHNEAVTAVHGKEWMKELQGLCDASAQKVATAAIEIARPPDTSGKAKDQFHTGDLYLCQESINAFEGALGGVCDAVDMVFSATATQGPKQAFACVRPPGHHCSSDWPSGFCWLNNVHVGIQHAVQQYGLTHAAIIDFDLHHGDGSQDIAWDHNERMQFPKSKNFPNSKKSFIGYFSLHDINSFPCEYGDRAKTQAASLCIDNAHGQAIWNVHLEKWDKPEEFWHLYETRYKVLLDKTRKFLRHRTNELRVGKNQPKPRSAIFISAGFDASEHEGGGMQRHSVNVLTEFYARFTRDIVQLANEDGTAAEGRVISVLEGGYSDKALVSGVLSHISGLCEGNVLSTQQQEVQKLENGLSIIGLSGLPSANPTLSIPSQISMKYNTEWWHDMHLDTLVHLLHPAAPVDKLAPKKSRVATYSSPTHASSMKIIDPNKIVARNPSFGSRAPSLAASRATSPPPPDVDWAVASSELCKLLIPKDRAINSHTQEDLNPKDLKIKKERVVDILPPPTTANGRALRERKGRASIEPGSKPAIAQRKASIDRRQTIAAPLPSIEVADRTREPRRRTSIASTISTTSVAPSACPRPMKATPVEVKKTRPTSSTTSSRASSVKPQNQTVARVPSTSVRPKVLGRTPSNPPVPTSSKPESTPDLDIDSLTSGLKKITIKVPSNEEYAARQSKASTITSSRTTAVKKPIVARTTKPATATTTTKRPSVRESIKNKSSPQIGSDTPKVKTEQTSPSPLAQIPTQPPTSVPIQSNLNQDQQATFDKQPTKDQISQAVPPVSSPISSSSSQTGPSSYQSIQFAPPNSDQPTDQSGKFPPNTYSAGFQWMPPNADSGAPVPKPSEIAKMQKTAPAFTATGHIPFAQAKQEK